MIEENKKNENIVTETSEKIGDKSTEDKSLESDDDADAKIKQSIGQKILKFSFFFILIVGFTYAVFLFIFNRKIKPTTYLEKINSIFVDEFKEQASSISIKEDIELKLLPVPYFIIKNVSINSYKYNDFIVEGNIKKVTVKFPFIDVFFRKLMPERITFDGFEIIINEDRLKVNGFKRKRKIEDFKDEDVIDNDITIDNEVVVTTLNENIDEVLTLKENESIDDSAENQNDDLKIETVNNVENIEIKQAKSLFSLLKTNVVLSNGLIVINGLTYNREFSQTNLSIYVESDKFKINGSLLSNKQPIKLNTYTKWDTTNFETEIKTSSEAFNFITKIKGKTDFSEFSGNIVVNANSLQIFIKSIFNTNSLIFNRIIDNSKLNTTFNIGFKDKILSFENMVFNGVNLSGKGDMEFNFNQDMTHKINLSIASINLDKILLKSMEGKEKFEMSDIYLFNKDEYVFKEYPLIFSRIGKLISINPLNFIANIDNFIFWDTTISNIKIDFLYDEYITFNNFDAKINNSATLTIDNNQDFLFKGDDLSIFVKNGEKQKAKNIPKIENKIENDINTDTNENKDNITTDTVKTVATEETTTIENNANDNDIKQDVLFYFSGKIDFSKYKKIFLNDVNFEFKNFSGKSNIELHLDEQGFVFHAYEVEMENLDLEEILNSSSKYDNLKSATLFLNTFNIANFYRFNIANIKNNDWSDVSYKFDIMTNNGYLSIYNINFNEKVSGNVSINIKNEIPKMDLRLKLINYEIKDKIDFNKLIFNIPAMNEWIGNINLNIINSTFMESNIGEMLFDAPIKSGLIDFNIFKFTDSFGGKSCNIKGYIDMNYNRRLNLSLSDCIVDLGETLYIFTNTTNINGLIGLGAIVYTEGLLPESFTKSYIVKVSLAGSGVNILGFGMRELNNKLLSLDSDETDINSLSPLDILYDKQYSFFIEKMTGNISYDGKTSKGNIDLNTESKLINGKMLGTFDIFSNTISTIFNINFVMLAGNVQRLVPLNISINFAGETGIDIKHSDNIEQVVNYLDLFKKQIETKTTD
jgi:hypothetical protein